MKNFLFLFLFLFLSCKKDTKIEVFSVSESYVDGSEIRGNSLDLFFNYNSELIKIRKRAVCISKTSQNKLQVIKERISNEGKIDTLGMGVYFHAIIFEKDTLYSNSDFKSWKFKGRILYISDNSLEMQIKE